VLGAAGAVTDAWQSTMTLLACVLAPPAGACGLPRVNASSRPVPRKPRAVGTARLFHTGAAKSLHQRTAPSLSVLASNAQLHAACSALVLLPATAAAAAPLDPAAVETVQQVLFCTRLSARRGAFLMCAATPQVSAVLNVAAAPLALVFSAVLFLFMSLKGDLAKLEKELGKKTDDLKSELKSELKGQTDDLKSELKGQTIVLGVLSLLTLFSAYSAFAAPK
jgi:hypothetical protein